jgi:hypothetical protein
LQLIDPNLLGDADNIDRKRIHPMAWCLAKIMLLFEPSCSLIPPPPSDADERLHNYFKLAMALTITTRPGTSDELLLQIPSLEDWIELVINIGISKVVLDVIRLLAVPNPAERPSALQALESSEYKALQATATAFRK